MREEPGERVFDIPDEPPFEPPVQAAPVSRPAVAAAPAPVQAAPAPAVKPAVAAPAPSATPGTFNGGWWRALAESCKGRLPPMYRVILDICTGALEGDLVTVYVPDEMALGRLDNERVRTALTEEAVAAAGVAVRLTFRVGQAVEQSSPEKNLANLLKFGSQFDNIEIK